MDGAAAVGRGGDDGRVPGVRLFSATFRTAWRSDRGRDNAGVDDVAGGGASAEIDMLQLAWVAGAVLCFVRAVEHREAGGRRTEWLWLQAALLCMAGGALTKWTAPAFFYLMAIPFSCGGAGFPCYGAGRTC